MFIELELKLKNEEEVYFCGLADDMRMKLKEYEGEIECGVIWADGKVFAVGFSCLGYWPSKGGRYRRVSDDWKNGRFIWDVWP